MHVVEQINLTKLVDCFWMVTIYDGMASVRLPNSVLSNTSDVDMLNMFNDLYLCACRDELNVAEHMAELQTKVIHKVPGKWRDITIQLKFTFNATQKIKGDSEEERCRTMLGAWLRRNKQTGDLPRTRGSLYDALVETNCRYEAEALLRGSGDYRLPVKPTEGM